MTITYANGQTIKGALVVRTDNRIRVALAGSDDLIEFTQINGTWVSEDCEPVQIDFGWPGHTNREYKEEDFVCSQDLAARLIDLLLNVDDEEEPITPTTLKYSTAGRFVV